MERTTTTTSSPKPGLQKIDLLRRALALKHKLKVHDSLPEPDNHEDLALYRLSRWELEDELRAIELILDDLRLESVKEKRAVILKKGVKKQSKK